MRPELPDAITGPGVVAIGRGMPRDHAIAVAEVLWASGVRAFEIPLSSEDALDVIKSLAIRFRPDQVLIGAGTVLSVASAEQARDAGAQFIVMPHVDVEIIGWAAARGVPNLPGAMTPTEVLSAWRAGASAVKIFPASVVGPQFLTELRGPFPDIRTVPTGGITPELVPSLIAAGAVAVGVGSWLSNAADLRTLEDRATTLCAIIDAARESVAPVSTDK